MLIQTSGVFNSPMILGWSVKYFTLRDVMQKLLCIIIMKIFAHMHMQAHNFKLLHTVTYMERVRKPLHFRSQKNGGGGT